MMLHRKTTGLILPLGLTFSSFGLTQPGRDNVAVVGSSTADRFAGRPQGRSPTQLFAFVQNSENRFSENPTAMNWCDSSTGRFTRVG